MLFKLAVTVTAAVVIRVIINLTQPKCKPRYGVKDRTIIVTGGNSGIGYEIVKYLYKEGATVILACRNETRAEDAIKKIKKDCKNDLNIGKMIFMQLDLNSFASIHLFANQIEEKGLNIFALINNAGVFGLPFKLNEYGFDEEFTTNHLGAQLLNDLLLPNLVKNGTNLSPSKIVYVSSVLYNQGKIEDEFFKPFELTEEQYKKSNMYSNSKLASLLYGRQLAQEVSNLNYPLYVNFASPGLVATNLSRHDKYRWLKFIFYAPTLLFILKTPRQGCQTILECVMANNLSSNGKYFRKCKEFRFSQIANDQNLIEKVYRMTRTAIGIKE